MEITLLQIYALEQNALSYGIQPVSKWGWCGESECAAAASWSVGIQELRVCGCHWGLERALLGNHRQELMRGGNEPPEIWCPPSVPNGVGVGTRCTPCVTHVGWSLSAVKDKGVLGLAGGWVALGALGSWFQSVLPSAAASGKNTCPQCLSAASTVSLATGKSQS